ncbi:MAG: hypothetical protein V3T17_09250, partial [Pseudomonadales bacterium]
VLSWSCPVSFEAVERLELYAWRQARIVLRGGSGGNVAVLPDLLSRWWLAGPGCLRTLGQCLLITAGFHCVVFFTRG